MIPLLLAATVRRFARIPLGLFERNTEMVNFKLVQGLQMHKYSRTIISRFSLEIRSIRKRQFIPAIPKLFWERPKSEFAAPLRSQASNRIWKNNDKLRRNDTEKKTIEQVVSSGIPQQFHKYFIIV